VASTLQPLKSRIVNLFNVLTTPACAIGSVNDKLFQLRTIHIFLCIDFCLLFTKK